MMPLTMPFFALFPPPFATTPDRKGANDMVGDDVIAGANGEAAFVGEGVAVGAAVPPAANGADVAPAFLLPFF